APSTDLYPLSLHDALPIFFLRIIADFHHQLKLHTVLQNRHAVGDYVPTCLIAESFLYAVALRNFFESVDERTACLLDNFLVCFRSEEHTSELQSRENLVCR